MYPIRTLIHYVCLALLLISCGGTETSVSSSKEESMAVDAMPETRELDVSVKSPEPAAVPETVAIEPVEAPAPPQVVKKPAKDATATRNKPVAKPVPSELAASQASPASTAATAAPSSPAGGPGRRPDKGASAPATAPQIVPADAPDTDNVPPAAPPAPDHAAWNALLQKHVTSSGKVNYAGFKQDEAELDVYLKALAESTPQSDWGRKASLAYWINAYNAFTVKRILKDYPLKSITDLDGGDPWKVKWITLDGKSYSLNNIEHDIIRPRYKEPRIHFAVNCAATSCPPIPNKAFTAGNLNAMLESGTRRFINNPAYNQVGDEVKVSKIFDWYGEDFGDLRDYLNKYLATPIAEEAAIGFKEYDWALNKQ